MHVDAFTIPVWALYATALVGIIGAATGLAIWFFVGLAKGDR